MTSPRISLPRLRKCLEALGAVGRDPAGGCTRLPFSPAHTEAVRLAAQMMKDAGLDAGVDEFGILIGLAGGSESRGALLAGSHLDTVPQGGLFDGALGVAAAVECAQALREARLRLRHDFAVIAFADEEGSGFGVGTLSSRLLTGGVSIARTGDLRDRSGRTLGELLRTRAHGLPSARVPERVRAFLELHIEQGPRLERMGLLVAAVDHVTGIVDTTLTFHGQARHAGTTPMDARADALLGAAAFVQAVHDLARATGGRAVATAGRLTVSPGARNVIPGAATVTVEVRSPDGEELEQLRGALEQRAREIASDAGLRLALEPWDRSGPQPLDPVVREASLRAMTERGSPRTVLSSWAGHDAAVLARHVPAGMLFVQSTRGISHSPDEHSSWEAVEAGTQVLLDTLVALDATDGPIETLPLAYGDAS